MLLEKAEMLTVLSVGFLVCSIGNFRSLDFRQKVSRIFVYEALKGEAHNTPSLMSTKFFNNIETTLMDKFHFALSDKLCIFAN